MSDINCPVFLFAMNKTFNKSFLSFLMIAFCVSSSMAVNGKHGANVDYVSKSSKSLEELVEKFLSTNDVALAEEILVSILSRSDVSTSRVAGLIHSEPRFSQGFCWSSAKANSSGSRKGNVVWVICSTDI